MAEFNVAWTFETDPARQREILRDLERVHVANVTDIPLGQYRSIVVHRRNLHNLRGLRPRPALFYWNLEKG